MHPLALDVWFHASGLLAWVLEPVLVEISLGSGMHHETCMLEWSELVDVCSKKIGIALATMRGQTLRRHSCFSDPIAHLMKVIEVMCVSGFAAFKPPWKRLHAKPVILAHKNQQMIGELAKV